MAFLLSGPVFEELGCTGRTFVAAARAAYSDSDPGADPDDARRLARQLLTHTGQLLERLMTEAGVCADLLEKQERVGQRLDEDAASIAAAAQAALAGGLSALSNALDDPALDDPEALATRLSAVATEAFGRLRQGWAVVYGQLPNATLPQTPMAFSQRQMYIETVKLFNQHRLSTSERNGASDRSGSRGIFGRAQRPARSDVLDGKAQVLGDIVGGGGEIVRGALDQWHRGALERARRTSVQAQGVEAGTVGDMPLPDRLELIQRTHSQLVALRRELARGLSAQWFLFGLLRRVSTAGPRPEAC